MGGSQDVEVFTVGHSDHELNNFLRRLKEHGITTVADVRSVPYSRFRPHFNRETFKAAAQRKRIRYVYAGDVLGGRPDDRNCYDPEGRVIYEKVAETEQFRSGLEQIIEHAVGGRLVLMCSEEDPVMCHRTLLVAHQLEKQAQSLKRQRVTVKHIRAGSGQDRTRTEKHNAVVDRLVKKFNLDQDSLFGSTRRPIERAVERQSREVAFVDPDRAHIPASSLRQASLPGVGR